MQLALLPVVDGEALEEEGAEAAARAAADGVEDQEALQPSAVVSKLTDAVQHQVDDLLSNSIVSSGKVIRSIFLTGNQLFRMEQLTIGTSTDFINNSGLQVYKYGSRNMFTSTSLGEKGVESIITTADRFILNGMNGMIGVKKVDEK